MLSSLIPELQVLVLEAIADNSIRRKGAAYGYPLSRCASVCKGWQEFFEKINFRQIVLSSRDVESLHEVFGRRKDLFPLVQHIWFRVEVRQYGCDHCSDPQSFAESATVGVAYLSPSYSSTDDSIRLTSPQPMKSSIFLGFYHNWNARFSSHHRTDLH